MKINGHKYYPASLRRFYNKSLQAYAGITDIKNKYWCICMAPLNCDIYAEWDDLKGPRTSAECEYCPYEIEFFSWEEF